jgi:hypothetical protein
VSRFCLEVHDDDDDDDENTKNRLVALPLVVSFY